MRVTRHGRRAGIVGAALLAAAGQGPAGAKPPKGAKPVAGIHPVGGVTALAEAAKEFHAADGGRALAFYEPASRAVAVYDTATGKQTGSIPVGGDDALLACGKDCVIVALPQEAVVQRWDLKTLKRTRSAPLPADGPVRMVRMGCASAGPVYVVAGEHVVALDGATLAPLELTGGPLPSAKDRRFDFRVSADGTTVVTWPDKAVVTRVVGTAATVTQSPNGFPMGNRKLYPTADGSVLLYEHRTYAADGRPIGHFDDESRQKDPYNAVPTADPRFYVRVKTIDKNEKVGGSVSVCAVTGRQVLGTIPDVGDLGDSGGSDQSRVGVDEDEGAANPGEPRAIYLPEAKVVATVPVGNKLFTRIPFDADALMAAGTGGAPPLAVVSRPPATVPPGGTFDYAVQAWPTTASGLACKLESGPDGMTVTPAGRVTWHAPADGNGTRATVILTVSDASGHEAVHSFEVRVGDGDAAASGGAEVAGDGRRPAGRQGSRRGTAAAAVAVTTRRLDEPFHEFHAADGGRQLVFYERTAKRLAVYPAGSNGPARHIPVAGEEAKFACGSDCAVVYLPGAGVIERWDLRTLRKTATVPVGAGQTPKFIRMGCASAGPVYLCGDGRMWALDGRTLQPLALKGELPKTQRDWDLDFRVSADGTTVVAWQTSASPSNFTVARVRDGAVTTTESAEGSSMGNRRYTPTADGSLVFYERQVFGRDGREIGRVERVPDAEQFNAVPAADPRFYFRVAFPHGEERREDGTPGKRTDLTLCATSTREAIATLRDQPDVGDTGGYDGGRPGVVFDQPDPGEPRVFYLPQPGVVVTVPAGNESYAWSKLDVSAGSQLTILSMPPADVAVGGKLAYAVQTLPAVPGLTYKLESGPAGMTVSPQGLVTWSPTDRPAGGKASIVLSVTSPDGRTATQAFEVAVTRGGGVVAEAGGSVVRVNADRLELPTPAYFYGRGDNGTALLVTGDQLSLLAGDGFTVESKHTLPKIYSAVAAREGYYVGICQKPASIDVIDGTTFKVTRSRAVAFPSLGDLAANPVKPVCYVSHPPVGKDERWHFLIFDEQTADAKTDDSWVGQWLAVAADGKFLLAGSKQFYQNGVELIDNPNQLLMVPTYDTVERLIRFDLDPDDPFAQPSSVAEKQDVGGGGSGLRLAPDGKRATYLSHTGFPRGSGCLGGWDPMDLDKLPVAYGTKEAEAATTDLAFHPTLPLVAAPGKSTVAFFDRETGARLDARVDLSKLAGEDVGRVYFAPDGKSLVVQTTVGGIAYLNRLALK